MPAKQADRAQGMQVGEVRTGRADIRLDGVHQGIDPGAQGQVPVHGQGGCRVDQGHIGHHAFADDGDLHPGRRIVDDGELGNIGGGAGGGGNADERRAGHIDPVDSLEIEDVAVVGRDNADALGAIHRTAPAHGDDDVAIVAAIGGGPFHHLVVAGVGTDPVVHHRFHPGRTENGHRPVDEPGPAHPRIGDHKHTAGAKVGGVTSQQLQGAVAEYDLRGNKLPYVPHGVHTSRQQAWPVPATTIRTGELSAFLFYMVNPSHRQRNIRTTPHRDNGIPAASSQRRRATARRNGSR